MNLKLILSKQSTTTKGAYSNFNKVNMMLIHFNQPRKRFQTSSSTLKVQANELMLKDLNEMPF